MEFNFEEELKRLPDSPGVYLMHDKNDTVIYVGKAKVLKNRVRQYFHKSANHTPKVLAMVSNIAYFKYIVTDSETEALALECNLIKKYRPRYNILLKDDKHYPYLRVSINEDYPRITMTRKLQKDGAKYYGPYVGKGTVKNTLDIIQKLFKPPMCSRKFPQDIKKGRPCLNYHINNCFAPCTGNVSKSQYRAVFFEICRFLEGNHKQLLEDLAKEMKKESEALHFEAAAAIRDKIKSIKSIEEKQKIIDTDKQIDKDVIAVAKGDNIAFCQMFFVRGGKVIGAESYKLNNVAMSDEVEIITDFVEQFYQSAQYIPQEIITEYEVLDLDFLSEWLREKRKKKVTIISPKRGEKLHLVKMVKKNAEKELQNYIVRQLKEKEKNTLLESFAELTGVEHIPMRIEAYDISNIQGADNVGAMVVFENGKSAKRKYRLFKIKSFEGADDYSAMKEVIYRRFRHAMEEEELIKCGKLSPKQAKFLPVPDVILLDGGRGHISVISELMEMMDLDIPLFGMVKNDRHRTNALISQSGEIAINQMSPVFKMITNIQDEVHNAAISYYRKLHNQIKSELDKINGVGEKRRQQLMKHFGNVDMIKRAELHELEKCVDKRTAKNVYEYFHG